MAKKKRYLKITLEGQVVEDRPSLSFFGPRNQLSLTLLLRLIEAASRHKKVQALLLVVKNLSVGWGAIQEIHQELQHFHEAGKRSLVYLEMADNKNFYLASGAQQVYVPPAAPIGLVGLRAEMFFLKNLLEYLGVEPQLFGVGKYKSAGEMFTRENMSEPYRFNVDSVLTDLQKQLVDKIAARSQVTPQQVQEWVDQGPYTARQAAEQGLVNGILYQDEVEELLKESEGGLRRISPGKLGVKEGLLKRWITFYRPQIAYLVAEGVLTEGESPRRRGRRPALDSESLARFLRSIRRRKRVKAVVLRINSPGGSALTSDLLWREIQLTDQKKPVIVSFGDVAASGGYYLATAARGILGMPATLTGSIGVISGKFNLAQLLSKLGVTVDALDKGERAGYLSAARPFSKEEAEAVQEQGREFYEELFLEKVAKSRGKSPEEIRKLAEGRVWTGAQALENGLVDQIGGLVQAIERAQQEAGLPERKRVRLVRYFRRRSLKDLLSFPLPGASLGPHVLALMPDDFRIQ